MKNRKQLLIAFSLVGLLMSVVAFMEFKAAYGDFEAFFMASIGLGILIAAIADFLPPKIQKRLFD